MKGYKGFEPGLICKGKQYAENTVFEEPEAKICECGMHFCENPLDVLDYYPLVNDHGQLNEFCEVEALDDPITDDNKKYVTKKLKIGAKLSLSGLVKAAIDFVFENTKGTNKHGFAASIASDGNAASIASDGNAASIASGGYAARIASGGDFARIASGGNAARIASGGDSASIVSGGDSARIASGGDFASIVSGGDSARIASGGDSASIASGGDSASIVSGGDFASIVSGGDSARIASGGDFASIVSGGDFASIASGGAFARIASTGKNAVVCCIGVEGMVKAVKGNWITLAEYDKTGIVVCVKTEYVDGERIKADTFYKLQNGEFTEVKEQ